MYTRRQRALKNAIFNFTRDMCARLLILNCLMVVRRALRAIITPLKEISFVRISYTAPVGLVFIAWNEFKWVYMSLLHSKMNTAEGIQNFVDEKYVREIEVAVLVY